MNDYRLTISVNIKGQDDPEVRAQVKELMELVSDSLNGAEIKLQQVFQNSPPRKVQIDTTPEPGSVQDVNEQLFVPLGQR